MLKINDSVALVQDPEFRDVHYHARQYGRVIDISEGAGGYRCGTFVTVDWSDMGNGHHPTTTETYAPGSLRVVYPAPEVDYAEA